MCTHIFAHACTCVCLYARFHSASVYFLVLGLFPDFTFCSGGRKDTKGCQVGMASDWCSGPWRSALQPSPTISYPVLGSWDRKTLSHTHQKPKCVEVLCPSAHEQKSFGFCSEQVGARTGSGEGPSLCHTSVSIKPWWTGSSKHDSCQGMQSDQLAQ
jgi:hypothetical protein